MVTTQTASIISYPQFKELHAKITACKVQSVPSANDPHCMSIEGDTGAGKSTLARTYAEAFPPYEKNGVTCVPVFYFEVPAGVTIKGLAATMLETIGAPGSSSGSRWALDQRLISYIKALQVEVIIIDEFQHLIEQRTNKVSVDVSDWLKTIIKATNVPTIVIGVSGQVEPILKTNPQLSRLFARREKLSPFVWNSADVRTWNDFSRFIEFVELSVIKCLITQSISRTELCYRIFYATDGVVGNIINLMRAAYFEAQNINHAIIELSDLEIAFTNRVGKHLYWKTNPFQVDPKTSGLVSISTTPSGPPPTQSSAPKVSRRAQAKQLNSTLSAS